MVNLDVGEDYIGAAENDRVMVELALSHPELAAEGICFHCQQMVEKMLKQVWVENGVWPARSHDIDTLLSGATERGWVVATPDQLGAVMRLAPYATKFRYIRMQDCERGEAMEAVACVNAVADMLDRQGYPCVRVTSTARYLHDEADLDWRDARYDYEDRS